MLTFTFPRQGAILNAKHGREEEGCLRITVTGNYSGSGVVCVNGVNAALDGAMFRAEIALTEPVSTITASVTDNSGRHTAEIQVIWDRCSFKRYNFFIEDNSFFLTELAAQRPKSIFDHFYLDFLRRMHERYGVKMTLECFYQNAHDPNKFRLCDMPDCWKGEFEDNSDWLKMSFHAFAEFPDRTCQDTAPEVLAEHFRMVNDEIVRFAGEKTLAMPTEIHWCMLSPAGQLKLASLGVKCLDAYYMRPMPDGSTTFCDLGYYLERPECQYLDANLAWHDFSKNITFTRNSAVCNLLKLEEIPAAIEKAVNKPADIINISSHEQYMFPFYKNYQPDHFQRMETLFRHLEMHDVRPVFFNDGFMGNPAWTL